MREENDHVVATTEVGGAARSQSAVQAQALRVAALQNKVREMRPAFSALISMPQLL